MDRKLRYKFIDKMLSYPEFKFCFIYDQVSEELLNRLYDTAAYLIHPTAESWGMQGQEAAARGCPILFLKPAGITDIVPNDLSSKETFDKVKKFTWERHCKELLCE